MSEALDEVKRRCEETGLEFATQNEGDPETGYPATFCIVFPEGGRDIGEVFIQDGAPIERLAREHFEGYRLAGEFEASWSPDQRVIECTLTDSLSLSQTEILAFPGRGQSQLFNDLEEPILGLLAKAAPNAKQQDSHQPVEFSSDTDLSISIGPCTNMHGILTNPYFWESDLSELGIEDIESVRSLTLQIRGAEANTESSAVELLQRVGDSLLFEIDLSLELPLRLKRNLTFPQYLRSPGASEAAGSLRPVRSEYDSEAMSLYWYGKSASAMPLLQFLAYYQVLEFYFHRYLRRKAEREILDLLGQPPFAQLSNADKSRLLDVIRHKYEGGRRLGGGERELLENTIKECVTPYDLRSFLVDNDARYSFYTSTTLPKTVSTHVIPILDMSPDHRESAAWRIYDIRCRIVHAKEGYETQGPLLPSDPEIRNLRHDIDLMEFLARKVLTASSKPLQV